LGSSNYITNFVGEVSQHSEYFAFGETFIEEHKDSHNSPYKFNGKELDEESGLYYYGARYYDPRISIWASIDPLVEQTMDAYGYCNLNPVNLIDPTGMSSEDPGEFEKDKDGKWKKTTDKGDDIGIDFYHFDEKDKDGNQITVAIDKKLNTAVIPNGREKLSGTKRDATVDWNNIYDEWKNDTGPEKSYFEAYHPAINDIKVNHLWGSAYSDFLDSGKKSDIGVLAYFVPILDNWLTAHNMQVQMMGSFRVDFYKIGDKVINLVTDTKSRTSFYLHLPVSNYRRGKGIIKENGMWYPPIQGENTTFQTYLFLTTPKK
jgi:RHS repeat-associated protein